MEKQTYTFEAYESLSMENSFGTVKKEDNIKLNVSVGINSEDYGWFEIYDIESGGNNWYAEGGLQIEGKAITGYDGVFALPVCVTKRLNELGYDTTEVE